MTTHAMWIRSNAARRRAGRRRLPRDRLHDCRAGGPGAVRAVGVRPVDLGDGHARPAQPGRRLAGRVEATVRNDRGQAQSRTSRCSWRVTASTGVLVEPSAQQSTTDGQGRAPDGRDGPAAAGGPAATASHADDHGRRRRRATSSARPTSGPWGAAGAAAGTLPPNRLPVAAFTVVAGDRQHQPGNHLRRHPTTDEGEPCGSLCTYQWDFGDFETDSGQRVTKRSAVGHLHGHPDRDRPARRRGFRRPQR